MKGKPLLILALALVIVPADAWAQWRGVRPAPPRRKGDISAFLGYQWGGGINTNLGRIKIEPDLSYGGEINIVARRGGEIVVLYLRQDTEATLTNRVGLPDSTLGGLAVSYFQIGGMGVAPIRGPAQPFAAVTFGMTWYDPKTAGRSSEWRFSGSLGGGVKLLPTRRFGIRAQARWWFTFLSSGSDWFCTLPGGCFVGTAGTLISQGEGSGGLMFVF
jgi:hypothetical protein